jgi:hypothetical protein
MMKLKWICLAFMIFFSANIFAQTGKDSAVAKSQAQPVYFKDFLKPQAVIYQGLFTIYNQENKYYLEIPDTLIGLDVLVVSRISKGAADIRGGMLGYAGDEINNGIVRFEKSVNDKIILRQISFSERSEDSTKQMYQAVSNSNMQPIASFFDIKSYSKNKSGSIIDVTDFLNSDNDILFFNPQIKPLLKIAGFQVDKSFISSIHAYPSNTEILTVKTYGRAAPPSIPGFTINVTGGNTISFELNTSMILLPRKLMQPRYADDRVGYFSYNYTDFDLNPQRSERISIIKRWRLEPKPEDREKYDHGELVDPQKPILFYIDPSTPAKWIPYLILGVNDWQKAFEAAGFKNAIQARKVDPQDKSWSIDDATHSVIVYKPSNIANASGPSICDPRSGEILESHINWYHNIMQLLHDWYMIQAGPSDPGARKMQFDDSLMGQLIRFVSSHEVGHALGLTHNFGSSATVPVDSLRSKKWLELHGHTPSIMDYARFNYVAQPQDSISQSGLFPRIGDYDKWAIEFGYRIFPNFHSAEAEKFYLNEWIIKHQQNKRLQFGSELFNRKDPRDQSEDLGDDAMKAGDYGIKNLQWIMPRLLAWTEVPGEGYNNLQEMYNQLVEQYKRYLTHVLNNLGAEYITPKSIEQPGAVFEKIPREKQRRAVGFFNKQLFTTPLWLYNKNIYSKIGGDPVFSIQGIQDVYLNYLLSDDLFINLLNAQASDGNNAYSAEELLSDLKITIWKVLYDHRSPDIYQRHLQKQYVLNMIKMLGNLPAQPTLLPEGIEIVEVGHFTSNSDVPSIARADLMSLQKSIKLLLPSVNDKKAKDHFRDILERIRTALNEK